MHVRAGGNQEREAALRDGAAADDHDLLACQSQADEVRVMMSIVQLRSSGEPRGCGRRDEARHRMWPTRRVGVQIARVHTAVHGAVAYRGDVVAAIHPGRLVAVG